MGDQDIQAANQPSSAATPAPPTSQWHVPSAPAPPTRGRRISARRWLGASVVGVVAWLATSVAITLSVRVGNASGLIGFVAGSWVTGRFAGAAGWRQWLLAGALTLLGVVVLTAVLLFLGTLLAR